MSSWGTGGTPPPALLGRGSPPKANKPGTGLTEARTTEILKVIKKQRKIEN